MDSEMNSLEQVSVIIPSYNSARFLSDAVDSALAQTYRNIEIIVVDDGSTDDTKKLVGKYKDRVRYLFKENGGVSNARNFGIENASGVYVAFLDADDYWLPNKIEKQIAAVQDNKNAEAAHTAFFEGDENLEVTGETRSGRTADVLKDLFVNGNVIGTPSSVLARKSLFATAGGFNPDLSYCADWDMWIRLAMETEFAYVDEPLLKYRQHGGNMSNNAELLETDSVLMFDKIFGSDKLPKTLRSLRRRTYGRNYMVLAGTYFQAFRFWDFIRCALKSVSLDFRQVGYLAAFPFRVLRRKNT